MTTFFRMAGTLAGLALAVPALAATTAGLGARATPPARQEIHATVFGNDPCPKGEPDEIVVCAHLPESERYRIPKRLRDEAKQAHVEQSWVARSRIVDAAGSDQRPDSCSPVGAGGQTGCFQQFMHDARIQREEDKAAAADVP